MLDLILYWHALEDVDISYKFFLHVTDSSSDELVQQIDFVPQSWMYPTDWWIEGEYITDPISLPLGDLPSGEYQIWLGIYDPETGALIGMSKGDIKGTLEIIDFFGPDGAVSILHSGGSVTEGDFVQLY